MQFENPLRMNDWKFRNVLVVVLGAQVSLMDEA